MLVFYVIVFFLHVGTPSIILIPAVQQATLGNTVQFTCFSYRAAWKHERGNLPENAVTYYVGNKTLLTIINVQWKNEGKYTCQKFQNRLYFDVTALLIVNSKPFLNVFPVRHRARPTVWNKVQFACLAQNARWSFEGKNLPRNAVVHSLENYTLLEIWHIDMESAGTYICKKSQENGFISENRVMLLVDENLYFVIIPFERHAYQGDTVQFKCLDTNGRWTYSIRRLQSNTLVDHLEDHTVLTIKHIKLSNTGIYRYEKTLKNGLRGASDVFLKVHDNPLPTVIPDYHRATYGDMVQFKCLNNHVNWTFDRNPLPQNALVHQFSDHSLLTILNIRRGNRGLYICHTNLGQDKAMLMVDDDPYITVIPEHHRVSVGDTVEFYCSVDTATWSHGRQQSLPLNAVVDRRGDHSLLKLVRVYRGNAGTYWCQKKHGHGLFSESGAVLVVDDYYPSSQKQKVFVTYQKKKNGSSFKYGCKHGKFILENGMQSCINKDPKTTLVEKKPSANSLTALPEYKEAHVGEGINFYCFTDNATWTHNKKSLPPNARIWQSGSTTVLSVSNVTKENEGIYTCSNQLQNELETPLNSEVDVILKVEYPPEDDKILTRFKRKSSAEIESKLYTFMFVAALKYLHDHEDVFIQLLSQKIIKNT